MEEKTKEEQKAKKYIFAGLSESICLRVWGIFL